jgi:hypothetical protein
LNPFYNATGNPGFDTFGMSVLIRGEFAAVAAGFDLVPQLITTGGFATTFNQVANNTYTLPISSGTLALMADVTAEATAEATARSDADAAEITARTNADAVETARATAAESLLTSLTSLRGYLGGLTLSNDLASPLTVLDISAGSASNSTAVAVMTLPAAISKSLSAFVAGSGNGGMGATLTTAPDTWYHVYLATIAGSTDVFFDTSFPPIHAPAGTTAHRRIGSFKLDGGANILPFSQNGDRFDWSAPILEFSGTIGTIAAVLVTLAGVPPGVSVQALFTGTGLDTAVQSSLYLSSFLQADLAPLTGVALSVICPFGSTNSFWATVATNSNAQMRRRSNSLTQVISVMCTGWVDARGRG